MEIKALDLLASLKFVITCAGKNDVRYYLNGVAFDMTQGKLAIVATDGHRGALVETKLEAQRKEIFIAERESIERLIKIIGKRELVSLEFFEDHATATVDGDVVKLEMIDGKYPDWRKAFSPPSDLVATESFSINAKYLGQATKVCEIFTGRYPAISLELRGKDSIVTLKPSFDEYKFEDLKSAACVIMPLRQ